MEVSLNLDLPVVSVNIHAPDNLVRPLSHDSTLARATSEYAQLPNVFASEANVFIGNQLSVSWKIKGKGRLLEISPLEFDADKLRGAGASVRLCFPNEIVPRCVALSEYSDEPSSSSFQLVVDVITVTGHLFTELIPCQWFQQPTDKEELKSKVTGPHTLEMGVPRMLKAVSPLILLAPQADGSIVRIDRSSPLDAFVISTIKNSLVGVHQGEGLGFGRLFRAASDRVPGQPGVSLYAVSALDVVNQHIFLTYSINNTVQTWSLDSNSLIHSIPYTQSSMHYRLHPTNLIAHNSMPGEEGHIESTVVAAYPGYIQVYHLSTEGELTAVGHSIAKPHEMISWFILSVEVLSDSSILVAFKQSLTSAVYILENTQWTRVGAADHSSLLELPMNNTIDAVRTRVVETSPEILNLAMAQLLTDVDGELIGDSSDVFGGFGDQTAFTIQESLESQLLGLVDGNVEGVDSQWLRLDTLCREIEMQGTELLCVAPALTTANSSFLWDLRAHGVTLLCIKDDTETYGANNRALDYALNLCGNISEVVLQRVAEVMFDSSLLLLDKAEIVFGLLRPHITPQSINDFGRDNAQEAGQALCELAEAHIVASSEKSAANESSSNVESTKLTLLGQEAVSMLVYNFATDRQKQYRLIVTLACVALVEGWIGNSDDSKMVRTIVGILRMYSFISALELKNLRIGVREVPLDLFGTKLALDLAKNLNKIEVLAQLLPPENKDFTPDVLGAFGRASNIVESSPVLTLLQGLSRLAGGDHVVGLTLCRQVSLSGPWPTSVPAFGPKPRGQSSWLYRVAKYAHALDAEEVAFYLAQLAEGVALAGSENYQELLHFLFTLAIKAGNLHVGYTALIRRFGIARDESEEQQARSWILQLVERAAQSSEEDARYLVLTFPFSGFADSLLQVLSSRSTFAGVPSFNLSYSRLVETGNYSAAAQLVYAQISPENKSGDVRRAELYSICLNILSMLDQDSRWLFTGQEILTMEDVKTQQRRLLNAMAEDLKP